MSKHISFNNNNNSFSTELKERVNEYFSCNGIKQTGTWKLYHKTIVLILLALAFYILLLVNILPVWGNLLLCGALGLTFAAIGFNVMHDGAHGSYSSKKWINDLMSYSLNAMGGSSYFWKVKHNVMHHAYTNIEGHDDDLDIKPFIRTNENQTRHWFHRYQHIYCFLLYTFTYVMWVAFRDFVKYFSGKISEKKIPKMSKQHHFGFWLSKALYFIVMILIPALLLGWINMLIGYLIMGAVCGLALSIVFQLAHIVEDSSFPMPHKESQKIEENWFIHQLSTTANFSTNNKIISWLVGGLNFQVEHHLFPRISHIHYPTINRMVKELCYKHDVKYIEYTNMYLALKAHLSHLRMVGQVK